MLPGATREPDEEVANEVEVHEGDWPDDCFVTKTGVVELATVLVSDLDEVDLSLREIIKMTEHVEAIPEMLTACRDPLPRRQPSNGAFGT